MTFVNGNNPSNKINPEVQNNPFAGVLDNFSAANISVGAIKADTIDSSKGTHSLDYLISPNSVFDRSETGLSSFFGNDTESSKEGGLNIEW